MLVPVKAFGAAKRRLADVLPAADRAELARRMATTVITAGRPLTVYVVCDDDEVARWAETAGTQVLWRPGHGLNGAVTDGVASLAKLGFTDVVVAHADLPLAHDLPRLDPPRPHHPRARPPRRRDERHRPPRRPRLPLRLRARLVPPPRGRGATRTARVCGCGGNRGLGLDVDLPVDLDEPAVREVLPWLPTSPGSRR